MHIESLLKVWFSGKIVGISFCADLRVSFDTNRRSRQQPYYFGLPFVVLENTSEHPTIGASGRPVFLFDPPARFVAVSPLRPDPESFEDFVIHSMEDSLAYCMTMIQGPSPDLRVQFCDQFSCRQISALLDVCSDLGKKCFDILLRWFNKRELWISKGHQAAKRARSLRCRLGFLS
jgi:hypothetical protein